MGSRNRPWGEWWKEIRTDRSTSHLVARFIKSHARSKDLVKLFSKPGHILSYDQLASRYKLGGERFKSECLQESNKIGKKRQKCENSKLLKL